MTVKITTMISIIKNSNNRHLQEMGNNDNSHNVNIYDIVCIQTILWAMIQSNILLYIYTIYAYIYSVYKYTVYIYIQT
jgi:hypothetical protein